MAECQWGKQQWGKVLGRETCKYGDTGPAHLSYLRNGKLAWGKAAKEAKQ